MTAWQRRIEILQRKWCQRQSTAIQISRMPLWEENSLYQAVFVITGYLPLACHWSIIAFTQNSIPVIRSFAILILWCTDVFFFFFFLYENQETAIICEVETSTHQYVYIYIYCHPQTDCFVVSHLFNVARLVWRFKLGSKPA